MALKDWEYDGYGLYKHKPTGHSVLVKDLLELKYLDWLENTQPTVLVDIIGKEFDITGAHDLPYYKKIVGNTPPEVGVRMYAQLSKSREKKLLGYKVLNEDSNNSKLQKNLQNVLLNENIYIQDMLDEIDKQIASAVDGEKPKITKRIKNKIQKIGSTKSDRVYNENETLLDFKTLQQFLSKLYNQNLEMAAEFGLEVGKPLNEQNDAKMKKDLERSKVLKQVVKEIPSSVDDSYTKRLLEEDKLMFDRYDSTNKHIAPGMAKGRTYHPSSYRGERNNEDREINRAMN